MSCPFCTEYSVGGGGAILAPIPKGRFLMLFLHCWKLLVDAGNYLQFTFNISMSDHLEHVFFSIKLTTPKKTPMFQPMLLCLHQGYSMV